MTPKPWVNEHTPECPVTAARMKLLDDLDARPGDDYLNGALPEYDNGGDQEVELCTCSRRWSFSERHGDPDTNYELAVHVDGAAVTREFDAYEEAIDAIGEAMLRKRELPESVVTLVVSKRLDGQEADWAAYFERLRIGWAGDPDFIAEVIDLLRTHVLDEGHELALS